MPRTYKEIFDAYIDYSKEDQKSAMLTQSLLSGTGFINDQYQINKIQYDRPDRLNPRTISLSAYDVRPEATRNLNQGFNSMLSYGRESGRGVNPQLLSRYADSSLKIQGAQAQIDAETRNKSNMLNFQAGTEADRINASMDAQDSQIELQLASSKAEAKMSSFGRLQQGVSNISNIASRSKQDRLQTEIMMKSFMDNEAAIGKQKVDKIEKQNEIEDEIYQQQQDYKANPIKRLKHRTFSLDIPNSTDLPDLLPRTDLKQEDYFSNKELAKYEEEWKRIRGLYNNSYKYY